MKISVVIPVYNVESYIHRCVNSIVEQDYTDYEIVFVDDGSTDNSGSICDEYAKCYNNVKVIHKQNEGSYQARVDGARVAEGDYIWFVDSDDWILQGALSKIAKYLASFMDVDVLIFSYCINGKESQALKMEDNIGFGKNVRREIMEHLYADCIYNPVWRKCIKKELIIKSLEDIKGYCYSEDVLISVSVLDIAEKVFLVEDVFYAYRVESNGMTRNYNARRLCDLKISYSKLLDYAKKWSEDNEKDYSFFVFQKMIVASIEQLRLLLESEMTWDTKCKEIELLHRDNFFKDCMTNEGYTPKTWEHKYLLSVYRYAGKGKLFAYKVYGIASRARKFVKNLVMECK